jgi:DNA-binding IclR family transcriptional regulator
MSNSLAGRKDKPVPAAEALDEEAATRGQRGIQSVEVGGQLLRALAHHGRPMALKDLAREAGMVPAKAHPYLVSFGKIGLVEQDKATGRYGLGPLALQLGLMSLHQVDPVRIAAPLLPPLASEIRHTVALAVWGNRGPTIVLLEESPEAVYVNMRHGTVFSMAGTASGRLFGAYLPADEVRRLYEQERRLAKDPAGGATLPPWRDFEAQLDEVRRHGVSRTEGGVVAGVSAMSAPVFDHRGVVVLALTAIGPSGSFDARWQGRVALALKRCAGEVSARLGHSPAA